MAHCTMVGTALITLSDLRSIVGDVMAALYIPCRRIACTLLVFGEPGFGLRPRLSPLAWRTRVPHPRWARIKSRSNSDRRQRGLTG